MREVIADWEANASGVRVPASVPGHGGGGGERNKTDGFPSSPTRRRPCARLAGRHRNRRHGSGHEQRRSPRKWRSPRKAFVWTVKSLGLGQSTGEANAIRQLVDHPEGQHGVLRACADIRSSRAAKLAWSKALTVKGPSVDEVVPLKHMLQRPVVISPLCLIDEPHGGTFLGRGSPQFWARSCA